MTDANIVIGIKGELGDAPTIKRNLDEISQKGKEATVSTGKLDQSFQKLNKTLGDAKTAFNAVFASFAVRAIAQMADEYTNLEARVRNATKSVNEAEKAWAGLRDVSNQTGSRLSDAVDVFQRLSFVRTEINATIDDMVKFTGTVQKLGVISGSSTQAMQAGLLQLGQAMSAGVVRAEEFNSVLENMPSVAKAMADQLGVTTGELRRLVLAGAVDSVDAFNAILMASQEVEAQYAQMPMTIGRAFAQLQNEFQKFVGETNKVSGAGQAIITMIDLMKLSVFGLGQAFEYVSNFIAAIFVGVAKVITDVINGTSATIDKLIAKVNGLTGSNISTIGSFDPFSVKGLSQPDFLSGYKDLSSKYTAANTPTTTLDSLFGGSDGSSAKTNIKQTGTEIEALRNKYQSLLSTIKSGGGSSGGSSSKTAITNIKEDVTEADKAMGDFVERIDKDFSQTFKSAFTNTDGGFKKMLEGWKSSFKDLLSELAYQAFARPILMSVVGVAGGAAGASASSFSGVSTGGSSGIFGSLSNIGSSLLNGGLYSSTLGNIGANIGANLFGGGQLLSKAGFIGSQSLGNLGYGAIGGGIASLLGLGGGTGGMIGGTLGSIAGGGIGASLGTVLGMAGGPVGAIVGSFLGTALGGLFGGGKPSDKSQGGVLNLSNLAISNYGQTGSKFSQENRDFATKALSSAQALAKSLQSYGATLSGSLNVLVGSRDGLRIGGANGTNYGTNSTAFINAISQSVLRSVRSGPEDLLNLIGNLRGKSAKQVGEALDIYGLIKGFEETGSAAKPLTDVLDALDTQFANLKSKAESLGLSTDKLTTSYEAQKKALIDNALSPLQDFLDNQALGSSSSLNPAQRLSLARSQFDTNLAAIQGGNFTNLNSITSQASSLLGIGRDVFASGEGFAALESYVRQSIAGIATDLGAPTGSLNDSIAREISVSTAQQISLQQQMVIELQAVRDENTKLRKSLERLANQMVVTA